jgi:hypothetical protein
VEQITSSLKNASLFAAGVVVNTPYWLRVEAYVFHAGKKYEVVVVEGDGIDWIDGSVVVSRGIGQTPYWAVLKAWQARQAENPIKFDQACKTLQIEPHRPGLFPLL